MSGSLSVVAHPHLFVALPSTFCNAGRYKHANRADSWIKSVWIRCVAFGLSLLPSARLGYEYLNWRPASLGKYRPVRINSLQI